MTLEERLMQAENKGYVTLCHPENNSFSFVEKEEGKLFERGDIITNDDGQSYTVIKVLTPSRVVVK